MKIDKVLVDALKEKEKKKDWSDKWNLLRNKIFLTFLLGKEIFGQGAQDLIGGPYLYLDVFL